MYFAMIFIDNGRNFFYSYHKIIIMPGSSFLGSDESPLTPPTGDEKTLALLSHIITFVFPILGPLVIYLIKKDESEFVAYHAKESLNFQITIFIICLLLFITIVGLLLIWAAGIVFAILIIVATIRASEGKLYKYPFCIRLIK